MIENLQHHSCHANWNLRFVCDCKKKHREVRIYEAIARELSPSRICVKSGHNVCAHRNIAMQLQVPPLRNGEDSHIVEIIGRTLYTVLEEGHFLTEVRFLHFDGEQQQFLSRALSEHFGSLPLPTHRLHN